MPASRKPDLIPAESIPANPAAPERGAWTMSFEVEEEEAAPPDPRTAATHPQVVEDSKVTRRPLAQEDSKVTRRPLAGRPNSDSANAPRPLAQTRGTSAVRGRERTRGPAGAMAAEAAVIEPPTPGQGARRVWGDSRGRVWVSEWNSGQVSVYDPASRAWRAWKLPGASPRRAPSWPRRRARTASG